MTVIVIPVLALRRLTTRC